MLVLVERELRSSTSTRRSRWALVLACAARYHRAVQLSDDVRALRFWRRFDVRTTALFGAPVLVLLAALGIASHRYARDAELAVLQARLGGIAIALAQSVDPEAAMSLRTEADAGSPRHRRIIRLFERVARSDRTVSSIYVVRLSEREGFVRFAADWVRMGTPATVGQLYDATQTDKMLAGFEGPIVESRIYEDEWGRSLSGYAPVRDSAGRTVALVGVDLLAERVERVERRALYATSLMVGVALALFAAGGALLGRNIRRPVERIIATTGAIAAGRLDARTELARGDELGLLARRIDVMASELEQGDRMRGVFGRYVSEDVARSLLSRADALGASEREVTVLFTDIRRYSTISEGLSPTEVLELLNQYFSAMTDLVDEHGGCVIELLGDGILASFGAPAELADHPERAVRCALAMRARLEQLDAEWRASGLAQLWTSRGVERLGARYGVHTGSVVAGSLGCARRTKYAVIGPAVNAAMRLEALNEVLGTSVLVSAEVLARLPADLAACAVSRGEHQAATGTLTAYSIEPRERAMAKPSEDPAPGIG